MTRELTVQNRLGTEVNVAAVADLVENDRQIASRMIAESLNIRKRIWEKESCVPVLFHTP
jgi:hypothetical protein